MNSIKVCEYSRSRSFHDDLILQDQASGERSQDHWSSGLQKVNIENPIVCCFVIIKIFKYLSYLQTKNFNSILVCKPQVGCHTFCLAWLPQLGGCNY